MERDQRKGGASSQPGAEVPCRSRSRPCRTRTRTRTALRLGALAQAGLVFSACAQAPVRAGGAPAPPAAERLLPAVPEVRGPLRIDVVHPPADEILPPVDSTFVFGSVGHGQAILTVNGLPVDVKPNGAWLAFLPVPADGRYELVARLAEQTERAEHVVEVAPLPAVDAPPGRLGVVPGSVRPAGAVSAVRGEEVPVRVQATAGAQATLVLPDGRRVPLGERPAVVRQVGFGLDRTVALPGVSEYVGSFRLDEPLAYGDVRPALADPTRAGVTGASIELSRAGETIRLPLEASVGVLDPGRLRVATVSTPRPDSTAVGQVAPGADQAWEYFWWNGTRLVLDGEGEGFFRVRLADGLHAWIAEGSVRLEPEGTPLPLGDVGPTITVETSAGGLEVRLHASGRTAYRLVPSTHGLTVEFFGATGRPAFVGYGPETGFLDRVHWEQPTDDRFRFHIDLKERLWGFRARWDDEGRLVVGVRRAPVVDPQDPLRGVRIAIDAGHPPAGARGPTGLTEAEATLAVTRRLIPLLEARGAQVVEVRPDAEPVALLDRVMAVLHTDAELSVSVHFNAFPDGVNPFENEGTHVFYYWPQAVELARQLQREIVAELGLRDQGVRFQNLAMARIGWTPAVLTETLFMMVPEHEAALHDARFLDRIAEAHVRGIERLLTTVGRERQPR